MPTPPLKAIALIKRKPGTTRQDFASHYEKTHVPLALKIFHFSGYIRNHITNAAPDNEPGFDVYSMFWYRDMQKLIANYERFSTKEGDVIRADELSFMEPPKNRSFMVTEISNDSDPWDVGFRPKLQDCIKLIVLVKNNATQFIDDTLTSLKNDMPQIKHHVHNEVQSEGEAAEFALITELWVEGKNAADKVLNTLTKEDCIETVAVVNARQTACEG